MSVPAVFLDRDNTLIDDPGFIDHPDKVRLMPGAADAVRLLHRVGFRVVVVTNQSGVARGLFTEAQLAEVHERLKALLMAEGAVVDAVYYCPYLDSAEAVVKAYCKPSESRKPAPGMLMQAAADLDLDLRQSWMIGDSARDVEAGRRAGCRTILVDFHTREPGTVPDYVAGSLSEAVSIILGANA